MGTIVPSSQNFPIQKKDELSKDFQSFIRAITISSYFQIFWKIFMTILIFYFSFSIFNRLKQDVQNIYKKTFKADLEIIQQCQRDYNLSDCQHEHHPEFVEICNELKRCMDREPNGDITSKIYARSLGQIIESFISQLSIRTIVTLSYLIVISFIFVRMY